MKEYRIVSVQPKLAETEEMLNEFAQEGWHVQCSYATGYYFVLVRNKKTPKTCNECGK